MAALEETANTVKLGCSQVMPAANTLIQFPLTPIVKQDSTKSRKLYTAGAQHLAGAIRAGQGDAQAKR